MDTLRDEPPVRARSAEAGLALRLWRLDRAATRSALRDLGVPVLRWAPEAELDSVLAPLPSGGARGVVPPWSAPPPPGTRGPQAARS